MCTDWVSFWGCGSWTWLQSSRRVVLVLSGQGELALLQLLFLLNKASCFMFVCNYEFMQYFKKVLNLLDWTSLPFWFCSGYGWFCYQTQSDRLLVVPALSLPAAASFLSPSVPEERKEPEVVWISAMNVVDRLTNVVDRIHLFFHVPMGHLVPHSVVYRDQQISITFLLFSRRKNGLYLKHTR